MTRPRFGAALVLAGCATTVSAHDFWIEPASYAPAAESQVAMALRVGMNFEGEPVPRKNEKVKRFVVLDARGETAVAGEPGADPAGSVRVGAAGSAVVGYVGTPSSITLDAKEFEAYLKEEGLAHVSAERARKGESGKPARETYSRCAKAIVRVGGVGGPGFERALGCDFELVPEALPAKESGGKARFRALYRGAPAPGIEVAALAKGRSEPIKAITGVDGRVELDLGTPGVWLVKSVHMSRAPEASGFDWESIWASVTLDTR